MMLSQTVAQASRRRTNLSRRDGGESAETPDDDVFIASSGDHFRHRVSFDVQTML
jgi:hypothetical protein